MAAAAPADPATAIRALAFVVPPFVMKEGDRLTGFSIDLWDEVSSRLKVETAFEVASDVNRYRDGLHAREAQVGVTPVFYSAKLDEEFDFSYPIMAAGLQVMVRDEGAHWAPTPLRDLIALLLSRSAAMWLGIALVIILIPAHVIWLLDRGSEGAISPDPGYFPGILDAMTWAMTALVGGVQRLPANWLARLLGLVWMFAGVVFIALYTARLTAQLTAEQIRGTIAGPDDLPGKRIGTMPHGAAASYLQGIRAAVSEFTTLEELCQALLDKKVDAVFFASPPLRYFAAHQGRGRVRLVGPEIRIQDVGLLFQLDDPLRRRVNSVILALREDGTYYRLLGKWFGDG
ncbi:MAG: transporter substrate-binding domain-containing protein [Dongiaceae bacterium]